MMVAEIGSGLHMFHFTYHGLLVHKIEEAPVDCLNWVSPGGLGPFIIYGHDASDITIESLYDVPPTLRPARIKELELMP